MSSVRTCDDRAVTQSGGNSQTYLQSAFLFDVLTSIPVAIIEYVTIQACSSGSEVPSPAQTPLVSSTLAARRGSHLRFLSARDGFVVRHSRGVLNPPVVRHLDL